MVSALSEVMTVNQNRHGFYQWLSHWGSHPNSGVWVFIGVYVR